MDLNDRFAANRAGPVCCNGGFVICSKPMASNSDPQAGLKRRAVISAVLLAIFLSLTGWLFYVQSTSWPHEGSLAFIGYVFLCPGIVFQSFSLAYAIGTGRPLTTRYVVTLVVSMLLGLVLAAQLTDKASVLAMSGFERAYAPFVAQVGANLAEPCGGSEKYFAIPAVAAYNEQANRRPTAVLNYDSKRFVVSFPGDSIDMDGSKIYFDSSAGHWRKFHNDIETESQTFKKLTEGLADCRLHSVPVSK